MLTFLLRPRMLFLSVESGACLGGLGDSLPGVREKAPFLFSCRSAPVGVEAADLQTYHDDRHTLAAPKCLLRRVMSEASHVVLMTGGHRDERKERRR